MYNLEEHLTGYHGDHSVSDPSQKEGRGKVVTIFSASDQHHTQGPGHPIRAADSEDVADRTHCMVLTGFASPQFADHFLFPLTESAHKIYMTNISSVLHSYKLQIQTVSYKKCTAFLNTITICIYNDTD